MRPSRAAQEPAPLHIVERGSGVRRCVRETVDGAPRPAQSSKVTTKAGLSMETQWARPRADVNRGLRRGAWYRVIALTPQAVVLDVNHNTRTVPREGVDIVDRPPQHWSIVPRPPGRRPRPGRLGRSLRPLPRLP